MNRSILASASNFGMPPIRIISQSGPFQHGSTPLDYRYGDRVLQVVVEEQLAGMIDLTDRQNRIVDLLRPSRTFAPDDEPDTLIYRQRLPGGKQAQGMDLELTNGSDLVVSDTARFVDRAITLGGFLTIAGSTADDGTYEVTEVVNDYTVRLDSNMSTAETGVQWSYRRGNAIRDLYCILELGPSHNREDDGLTGYREALRFVGNDPFWYGPEQSQSWTLPDTFDDLVFDFGTPATAGNAGAYFGTTPGTGRWLFADAYLSDQVEVVYWGTHPAYPTIEITGPATDPVITNDTLDVSISMNYTIGSGETVTIDTRDITAEDSGGNDLYSYVSGDIANFILSPDRNADRSNLVTATLGQGEAGTSAITLKWRNVYASA
jgi:hypothetical protein